MAKHIKLIRLITGELLIGEISEDEQYPNIKIYNPISVIVVPSKIEAKSPQIAFAPFIEFSVDTSVLLNNDHIMYEVTPVKEFIDQYKAVFSGIITPSSSLILPK